MQKYHLSPTETPQAMLSPNVPELPQADIFRLLSCLCLRAKVTAQTIRRTSRGTDTHALGQQEPEREKAEPRDKDARRRRLKLFLPTRNRRRQSGRSNVDSRAAAVGRGFLVLVVVPPIAKTVRILGYNAALAIVAITACGRGLKADGEAMKRWG